MGDANRQHIRIYNVNAHVDRAAADLAVLDVTLRYKAVDGKLNHLEAKRRGSRQCPAQSLVEKSINEIKVFYLKSCFGGPLFEVL